MAALLVIMAIVLSLLSKEVNLVLGDIGIASSYHLRQLGVMAIDKINSFQEISLLPKVKAGGTTVLLVGDVID
ncbi:hypothetical protein Patl1_12442 [Pistacia atlantica]|uniref:Uncharacterized protein n=1 Tax=Pistacia atlantica TaxID=434234 RepID=A0ACC1AUV4_9ROSI|nr:hypothetical protein Patl1_12442 [Pistacia atlantica]